MITRSMKGDLAIIGLILLAALGAGWMMRGKLVHEVTFVWSPDPDPFIEYQVFAIFATGTWPLTDDVALQRTVLKPDQGTVVAGIRAGNYIGAVRACRSDGACRGWGLTWFVSPTGGTVRIDRTHLDDLRFSFW